MSQKYIRSWNENKLLRYGNQILRVEEADSHTGTFYRPKPDGFSINYLTGLTIDVSNSKIYVCGQFSTADGSICKGVTKFDMNGICDKTFIGQVDNYWDQRFVSMDYDYSSGYLVCGGNIGSYGGSASYKVAKISGITGTKTSWIKTISSDVFHVFVDSSGYYILGGTQSRTARHTPEGAEQWYLNEFPNGNYSTCIRQNPNDISKIYLAGNWATYNGTPCKYFGRFIRETGKIDTTFLDISTGFNAQVYYFDFDSSNNFYIGGNFTTYFGSNAGRIIKLFDNSIGRDTMFDTSTGFNAEVIRVLVDDTTNRVYCAGYFTTYQGTSCNRIVALNKDTGKIDATFNIGTGFNDQVFDIKLDIQKRIYVVGRFSSYNNVLTGPFVRLNTDGTLDNYSV